MQTWDMINDRRSLRDIVSNWLRNWRSKRVRLAELANSGNDEAERIAHDLGLTTWDLRELAGKGPDSADLLPRRMAALHIDAAEIRRAQTGVLRDLQRLCTLCDSKGHCEHDLDRGVATEWHRYCPNADTLRALTRDPKVRSD
jgi:hypothetical protein